MRHQTICFQLVSWELERVVRLIFCCNSSTVNSPWTVTQWTQGELGVGVGTYFRGSVWTRVPEKHIFWSEIGTDAHTLTKNSEEYPVGKGGGGVGLPYESDRDDRRKSGGNQTAESLDVIGVYYIWRGFIKKICATKKNRKRRHFPPNFRWTLHVGRDSLIPSLVLCFLAVSLM